MAKFKMDSPRPSSAAITARLGAGVGVANNLTDSEQFKFVRLAGDSRYSLAVAGNAIEAQIVTIEPATQDGFTIGSVKTTGQIVATCDGLEATPGVGVIAVGDYVVVGTVVPRGTALSGAIPAPRVTRATNQPGAIVDVGATISQATVNAALARVTDQTKNTVFAWRVVSLGVTGAVGDTCLIERVDEV